MEYQHRTRWILRAALVIVAATLIGVSAWASGTARAEEEDGGRDIGRIVDRPDGVEGIWTIGDDTYLAVDTTQLDETNGELTVGTCAQVNYREVEIDDEDVDVARRISSLEDARCDDVDDEEADDRDDDGDKGGDKGRPDDRRLYGQLDQIGEGDSAVWIVDGVEYLVNGETELEEDHGGFEAGVCVKVKFYESDAGRVAVEIETERAYKCGAGDDDTPDDDRDDLFKGELYGIVGSVPENGIGMWEIGGLNIEVTAETEIDEEKGSADRGAIVKVEFTTDLDGNHVAVEIEVRLPVGHGGDDDADDNDADDNDDVGPDDKPWIHNARGHAYGQIGFFPDGTPGPIGEWSIGGTLYIATERTKFLQVNGLFGDDIWVRVKYRLDGEGRRIAHVIKTIDATRFDGSLVRLFGYVDGLPAATDDGDRNFIGTWTIGNVAMEATAETDFLEVHGLLGEGAFVGVKYQAQADGRNKMLSIKTLVPPGAGDRNRNGRLERMGDGGITAAAAGEDQEWVIAGERYLVTEATDLDETAGALTVDGYVMVNSYTGTDGTEVATQIVSVGENRVYLPFTINR